MRLAVIATMVAASLTAIVKHERPPTPSEVSADRPLSTRATRSMTRHPLPRRVNAATHDVPAKASHDPAHSGEDDDLRGVVTVWDQLAQCESSGDWHINTGNGYFGGLQFAQSTWMSFGGGRYAPRADLASRAQQIVVAQRVLAVQGWGAWPACSRAIGVR